MSEFFQSPALTLSLAAAAGMFAIVLGNVVKVPGILIALALGVALGPDFLNVVRPDLLNIDLPGTEGTWLQYIVGFCVSVILFEGAMSLNPARLRRTSTPVRRLISIGALIAAAGAAVAAIVFLGWPLEIAALFGALLIVTGPTVIAPLLRRIKAEKTVATVLSAEGVLGDAVGAVLATALLSVAIGPGLDTLGEAAMDLGTIVLVGGAIGAAMGFVIASMGRWRGLVQSGVNRIATLAMVLLTYQISHAVVHESGVVAVVVAGMVVGFVGIERQEEMIEFKEELSILFIGLLFVILAANVRVSELQALGWKAVAVAAAVMLVVRPASVLLSTIRSGLTLRQRLFIAWIGPRGIVAAAVASLFANKMMEEDIPVGAEFRAVVFTTIVVTVATAGLTGRFVGRLLKVLAKTDQGWAIFGANRVAIATALALQEAGEQVVLIDRNRDAVHEAQQAGLTVVQGNGLEDNTLLRAGIETRKGIIAMTSNDEVNLLFVQAARHIHEGLQSWMVVGGAEGGVTDKMIEEEHAKVFGGRKFDIAMLSSMIEEGRLELHQRKRGDVGREDGKTIIRRAGEMPLLFIKPKGIEPAGAGYDGVTDVVILLPKARQRSDESERAKTAEST